MEKLKIKWEANSAGWRDPFIDGVEVHPDAVEYAEKFNALFAAYNELADSWMQRASELASKFHDGNKWKSDTTHTAYKTLIDCRTELVNKVLK